MKDGTAFWNYDIEAQTYTLEDAGICTKEEAYAYLEAILEFESELWKKYAVYDGESMVLEDDIVVNDEEMLRFIMDYAGLRKETVERIYKVLSEYLEFIPYDGDDID